MAEAYGKFAEIYDKLTFDVKYAEAAARIASVFAKEPNQPSLVLDLACGTGTLTKHLLERGYDMIGVDASDAMLNIARQKCPEALLLQQDMREFELYGTVDAIVCMLDGVNYLTEDGDLDTLFHLCNNYLNPNGLLLFDMNTEYKFRRVLANQTFSYETDGVFYVWENDYDDETALCDFYLTFFCERDDGSYERFDEVHTERMYRTEETEQALMRHGFAVEGCFDSYSDKQAKADSERVLYVCRNVDPIQKRMKQE